MYSFPVIDGFVLTTQGLPLNGREYAASVPLLIGVNRDEGGISAPFPPPANASQAITELGLLLGIDTASIIKSGAFPTPSGPDAAFNVLNVTSRIITDGGLRCISQATAYSGAKHRVFPNVYAFQFNRTYQPPTFTNEACSPPKTKEFPRGDPSQEYFKCHAGELAYVLGFISREIGFGDRDGLDIPFSRLVLDQWAAFAKTGNPNPDIAFLKARNYTSTIEQLRMRGHWDAVDPSSPMLSLLQWDAHDSMRDFEDIRQCEILGYPIDYFEA